MMKHLPACYTIFAPKERYDDASQLNAAVGNIQRRHQRDREDFPLRQFNEQEQHPPDSLTVHHAAQRERGKLQIASQVITQLKEHEAWDSEK